MNVTIRYFAVLKEKVGRASETWATEARTASELYAELRERYRFPLEEKHLKLALNREYRDLSSPLREGDEVVFIPPVSGG